MNFTSACKRYNNCMSDWLRTCIMDSFWFLLQFVTDFYSAASQNPPWDERAIQPSLLNEQEPLREALLVHCRLGQVCHSLQDAFYLIQRYNNQKTVMSLLPGSGYVRRSGKFFDLISSYSQINIETSLQESFHRSLYSKDTYIGQPEKWNVRTPEGLVHSPRHFISHAVF